MGAIHMMRRVVMLASSECDRTFDYLTLSCGWSTFTLLLRLLLTATSAARRKFPPVLKASLAAYLSPLALS
jgi:hypothetical protein